MPSYYRLKKGSYALVSSFKLSIMSKESSLDASDSIEDCFAFYLRGFKTLLFETKACGLLNPSIVFARMLDCDYPAVEENFFKISFDSSFTLCSFSFFSFLADGGRFDFFDEIRVD